MGLGWQNSEDQGVDRREAVFFLRGVWLHDGRNSEQSTTGDRLFVYSDGIIECKNQQGEFFSNTRLLSLLNNNATQSLQNIIQKKVTAILFIIIILMNNVQNYILGLGQDQNISWKEILN